MSRTVRTSVLLLIAVMAWSSPVAGQAAMRGPVPSVLTSAARGQLRNTNLRQAGDTVQRDIRPTYWKEGALIGGLIGIAGGAVVGLVACSYSDEVGKSCIGSAALGALGGALVLAVPGALIGGQMHKGEAAE